jgi:predicted Na+-dependent transporter
MFFLMLGLGVTVDLPHFKQHFQTPKGILIGLFSQFAAMPAIAYCISYLYDLQPLHKVALVMTGCCPGGAMSNILCFFARADLDLSIAMTTASSIGSVVLMPMNIFIYVQMTGLADEVKIDFVSIGEAGRGTISKGRQLHSTISNDSDDFCSSFRSPPQVYRQLWWFLGLLVASA